MKLSALDTNGHIANCLQWLETLTDSGVDDWNPAQLAAAREALRGARDLMGMDLLTLAGERATRVVVAPDMHAVAIADACDRDPKRIYSLKVGGVDLRDVAPAFAAVLPPGTTVSLDTNEGAAVPCENRQGVYNLKIGGYVGGLLWGKDGLPHTCATCRHVDCFMHHEPCSQCLIGSGAGGGHADHWEPAP